MKIYRNELHYMKRRTATTPETERTNVFYYDGYWWIVEKANHETDELTLMHAPETWTLDHTGETIKQTRARYVSDPQKYYIKEYHTV